MNEKTKKILRYAAVGLGGLALGIGLLGGLAMCASSANRSTAESVNTILTKRNAQITTEDGNLTGFSFTLNLDYSPIQNGEAYSYTYAIDTTTYEPNLYPDSFTLGDISTFAKTQTFVNERYTASRSATQGDLRFLLIYGRMRFADLSTSSYYNFLYTTFVLPSASSSMMGIKNFVCTNLPSNLLINRLDRDSTLGTTSGNNYYLLTIEQNNAFVYSSNAIGTSITFQDVETYFYSQGYGQGYDEGESAGNSTGYNEGYADGYDQGYTDGDNVGYWAGYNEGIGTASSFTDISGNLNAVYDLTTMGIGTPTWQWLHGLTDVKIHTLLQFFDNDQNTWDCYIVDGVSSTQPAGTRTMYVDVAQLSSLDSQTIGFAIYTTASNVGLQEVGTAHFEFAQIRNVNNKSLANKLILLYGWTQNDTSYQAGYQAGLKDGFDNTNTNNVFSLFTSAFNAVGGFFNLKIFGFLPLYWFFLTPLFVAIITLLLRMVKH